MEEGEKGEGGRGEGSNPTIIQAPAGFYFIAYKG